MVDALLWRGVQCVTVLDVSQEALKRAHHRLGNNGDKVTWIDADVTSDWPMKPADIWHDRAMFHFLTESEDRTRYVQHLRAALKPGGSAIIATFAPDGPEQCSGLPVCRYDVNGVLSELGQGFTLMKSVKQIHVTPVGREQAFVYGWYYRAKGTDE